MPCSRCMRPESDPGYDVWMSEAEKLEKYARIVEIIEDRIALERHFIRVKRGSDAIQFMRADAYSNIVDAVFAPGTLLRIEIEEEGVKKPRKPRVSAAKRQCKTKRN